MAKNEPTKPEDGKTMPANETPKEQTAPVSEPLAADKQAQGKKRKPLSKTKYSPYSNKRFPNHRESLFSAKNQKERLNDKTKRNPDNTDRAPKA